VPRLYPLIRGQEAGAVAAEYRRSLQVLAYAKDRHGKDRGGDPRHPLYTKSGLMLGLGEEPGEVRQTLRDLREAGCDIVTIGQYLAPSAAHVPIARFVAPEEFEAWRREAKAMGFRAAAAGPFVRSSYQAEDVFGDAQA
jgi:lipoic acid synthetase